MIKIYTSPNCVGCAHAKKWLISHNIDFIEKDFVRKHLTKTEILEILKLTENGLEDIISQRSKLFKKVEGKLDDLKFNEMIQYIIDNSSILRRPIIIQFSDQNDPIRLLVGYNSSDIEIFTRSNNIHLSRITGDCVFNESCTEKHCVTCCGNEKPCDKCKE